MSRVLGLVCVFALVALATPCCLPEQASLDWKMDVNYTSPYHNSPRQWTVSGSVAFDFNKQLFFLQIDEPTYTQKSLLNLGKKPGSAIVDVLTRDDAAGNGTAKYCYGSAITGTVGKPWRCIIDNKNIFTKVDGEAGYLLFIPGLIYGPVSMQKDVCLPQSGDFELTFGPQDRWTATVSIETSNVSEKVDASVLEDPCKPDPTRSHSSNPFEIPTPDELVQMILSSRNSAKGGPTPFTTPTYTGTTDVSGNPSFDTTTSPATDETATGGPTPFTTPTYTGTTDVSGNPSFDTTTSPASETDSDEAEEGSDEEDEEEDEDDETRRRRCIIPGAICY